MPTARERLAELRALRASGKKRISTYEVEDQGDIYDEVDDDGYKKVIRNRLDQDDFVVDDNGAGYADDGREVWNEQTAEYDSDESDELPTRGKAAKRKREEEQQRKEKMNSGISQYFNKGQAAPKPKVRDFCLLYLIGADTGIARCYRRGRCIHGGSPRRGRHQRGIESRPNTKYRQVRGPAQSSCSLPALV